LYKIVILLFNLPSRNSIILYFLVDKDNKYSNFKNLFVDLSSIYAIKARISQKRHFSRCDDIKTKKE